MNILVDDTLINKIEMLVLQLNNENDEIIKKANIK